ncbi:DUF3352 domain-containing protein [Phycicoccus sp. MAQZ13P-2]|uniref:DUF3352 domain-containing protein n=1 Tax=Phycicoccus mangrovi TaxID=2840470 RepID=UPI001C0028E2|nr:DUF3352 domain-containing protein [Phycicoccus mangrovi]MBT9276040.1 DUF3352 domain-containing protein [Phycicoccus mangrovi]
MSSSSVPPSGPLRGPEPPFDPPAYAAVDGSAAADGSAEPVVTEQPGPRRGLGRGLLVGGVAALVVVGGAGAWAWTALGGGGDRPADVLPGTTFAYAAVDLDPGAGQKVEALRTLSKFPGLSSTGVSEKSDLGTTLTDLVLSDDECPNLDPARDVTPWLGQRAAVAGVTVGEDSVPVGVVQVTDDEAAGRGMLKLLACAENDDAAKTDGLTPTWVVRDGWAYVAQDADTATRVADAAAKTTLAGSRDYAEWTGAVGEQGLVTMYLAPKPGSQIRSLVTSLDLGEDLAGLDAATAQYDEFTGGAMTLRFAGGGLELEGASGVDGASRSMLGAGAGTSMASLPDDTLAALAVSPGPGWFEAQAAQTSAQTGMDVEELYSTIEAATGLELPGDLETLFGTSTVLSLGGGFDPAALDTAGPAALPVAAKVTGDAAGIQDVLRRLGALDPSVGELLATTQAGDRTVVVGPDAGYRESVATGGSLGSQEAFRSVVPHADTAVAAFYLDVDGRDNWLAKLAESDPEAAKNLEPLAAVGMSVWPDGDTLHTRLRVTTD